MRRVLRLARRLALGMLALVLLVAAVAWVLLGTTPGSRWTLDQGARLGGVDLTYGALDGALLGRLEIEDIDVRVDDQRATASRMVLDWQPSALLARRLVVNALRLHDLTLLLPESPPTPGEPQIVVPELPAVSLPLAVDVEQVEVTALRLGAGDAPPLVDRLVLSASVRDATLTVKQLDVARGDAELTLEANVDMTGEWPTRAVVTVAAPESELPVALQLALTGTVRQPVLEVTATAPFAMDATAQADLRSHPLAASVTASWRDAGAPGSPVSSPTGSLKLATGDRRFELDLAADVAGAPGELERIIVNGGGTVDALEAPFAFDSQWRWAVDAVGQTFAGNVTASGDQSRIALDHVLEKPFRVTTRGDVVPDGAATSVNLAGQWTDLAWPPGATDAPGSPEGSYSIAGGVAEFALEVTAALAGVEGVSSAWTRVAGGAAVEAPNPFDVSLEWKAETRDAGTVRGSGKASGDAGAIRFEHRLTGPGQLDASGTVTLSPAVALDVSGNIALPRWPLPGDGEVAPLASDLDARFTLAGPLDAIATRLDGSVETAAAGPLTLDVKATVLPDGARDLDVALGALEGKVTVAGDVGWNQTLTAALEIQAEGLDPQRLHPQAVGDLNARITTDLRLDQGKPTGPVILHRLGGTLGGYPVSGEGRIDLLGDGFEAKRIALRSGENTLAVNGRMADTLNLDLNLDAPDLKQLWPGLEGAVQGTGSVRGTTAAPTLDGSFKASNVRAGGARIRSADLDVDASLAGGARSSLTLRARDITTGGIDITAASVDLSGTTDAHRLALDADTSQGRFNVAARGALKNDAWSGRIEALKAAGTALGDWEQTAPWALRVDPRGADSDRACLASEGAKLCLQAARPGKDTQTLAASLQALPVARFAAWLPAGLAITGDLEAKASARRRGSASWEAEATVTPTPIRLRLDESTAGTPLELTLDDTRIQARHGAGGSTAELRSRIGKDGKLEGRVEVGPPGKNPAKLGGQVEATLPDLAPFRALVPALSDLAGRLRAAVTLAGTVDRPRIQGTAALEGANAGVAAAGIRIEDVAVRVDAEPSGALRLDGSVRSGGGQIKLTGDGRVGDGAWSARVNIKGEDFEAVKLIPVQARVSPDLQVEATPVSLKVRGTVHVPEATVSIQELPPDVVAVSDDEVIVGRESPEASALRQNLDVKVDLTLGPKVQISAFGLDTGLEGGLAVAVAGTSPPTARGTVTLRDGRFTAYGQDLQVRRGRLLFAGPVDNPGLDVRAVRDAGEVVAGIQVSGTAANIRSRVFSEPSLPQAEALSWLLTGRGLSGASKSDGSTMAGAAVALGLEQSEQVTRQIGSSLGLDELSVAPGDSLEESSLVLGKSLSPRLYIQYALGVLGGQGSVKLNYKVTDRISVEAESGESQGADVLYRLER